MMISVRATDKQSYRLGSINALTESNALSKKCCIAVLSFDYRRTTTLILNLVLKKVILLKLAMNSATKVCLM